MNEDLRIILVVKSEVSHLNKQHSTMIFMSAILIPWTSKDNLLLTIDVT